MAETLDATEKVLIIGGGHAAGQCAASLRQKGWRGDIVIAGEEAYPPYQRPPLSKAFLAGELAAERLFLKPAAFYDKERIDLRLGARATRIDRAEKSVAFEDGSAIDYDCLVIATGARVRRLKVPGADLPGVGYLRDIADVDALRPRLGAGADLVIVGAGYIGLEVAAVAAKLGARVTVLEAAGRVMSRVAGETISHFFEDLHRANGVDIRLHAALAGFDGEDRVEAARLADGSRLACDLAVIGVGVVPNAEIAEAAGLAVDDGVVVDDCTRTQDPAIYAVGDCTRHPCAYLGEPVRLESVHNALEQAKTAAAAICGAPSPYDQAPWFWSDQYDVKLQTVGIGPGRADREIVRGAIDDKAFSVFYFRGETLLAVDSVNRPADHMIARKIIATGAAATPAAVADPSFDLKSLISGR